MLNTDNLSGIYNNVNIALLTFFWGGILTGIAYTLNRQDFEINYRLKHGTLQRPSLFTLSLSTHLWERQNILENQQIRELSKSSTRINSLRLIT